MPATASSKEKTSRPLLQFLARAAIFHRQPPANHLFCGKRGIAALAPRLKRATSYVWAAPTTGLGMLVAAFALIRGRLALVDGVVEAHGPVLRWLLRHLIPIQGGASAMTLGHVVLGRDADALDKTRLHERVHVRQCERWGPLFVPAYLAASLWAIARGRHPYWGNRFEREAYSDRSPLLHRGRRRPRR
jgi:hypothetical protein